MTNMRPRFEDLKTTTMTLVCLLSGEVNITSAFNLLNITRIEFTPVLSGRKIKLPHSTPGDILSLRFRDDKKILHTRGYIRSAVKKMFRHAVTIDISVKEKNLSVKLTKGKMQMSGATSLKQGEEAATYIVDQLKEIQYCLDWYKANPKVAKKLVNWLKEKSRGDATLRHSENTESLSMDVTDEDPVSDYLLKPITTTPPFADPRAVAYLIGKIPTHDYHSEYVQEIGRIIKSPDVCSSDIGIKCIDSAMVNKNFDFGFKIDRNKLHSLMDQNNGFSARFESDTDHNVTVEIPYDIPKDSIIAKKKDKTPCHTFMIYRSGKVTLSGPRESMMADVFYQFYDSVMALREEIEVPTLVMGKKHYRGPRPVKEVDEDAAESIDDSSD